MKKFFIFLTIVFILIPSVPYVNAIIKEIKFNAECINYFELAADANNVVLAERYLTKGIEYLENHGLTSGDTKILVYRPTNDIGIWYENLKAAQRQTQELAAKNELTDLEESNCLMKLRETLLNNEGFVNQPSLIAFHPNAASWFWKSTFLWLFYIAAFITGTFAHEEY